MDPKTNTEAGAIAALAQQNVLPTIHQRDTLVEGSPPFAVHRDGRIESLEHLLPKPLRIAATVVLEDVSSFIAYVKTYATAHTLVLLNTRHNLPTFTALLDYHGPAEPSRLAHVARLELQHSAEWEAWMARNNRWMGQDDFARFVEANMADILSPPAAEMLEIVKTLEGTQNVEFKSALRLDNGDRSLGYVVKTGAKAGAQGELTIPQLITVQLCTFDGGEPRPLVARFRWNIDNGDLKMAFDFDRVAQHVDTDVALLLEQVQTHLGRMVLRGQHNK